MSAERQYWAFMSYSHEDRRWAQWLHRALETYVVPKRLVGRPTAFGPAPRQVRPIFKDREDLQAGIALRPRIHEALASSRFLIVVCSPAAVRSSWVNDEIQQFRQMHGSDCVLAAIVDGPNQSDAAERLYFPAALYGSDEVGEAGGGAADILAADLRPQGDGRRLGLLKLLARILDVELDDLAHRDHQRRQRQMLTLTTTSASIAVIMGALAGVALLARDEASARRADAEGMVDFMLSDLAKKLEPDGRLDVLDAIGTKAIGYYRRQTRWGIEADGLSRRARVLALLGKVADKRGRLQQAMTLFQQAAATTAELLERRPNDPQLIFDHAQNLYWIGYVADERGLTRLAQTEYEGYKFAADRLAALAPREDRYLAETGYADTDLGSFWLKQGRAAQAAALFREGLQVAQGVAARSGGDRDRLADVGANWAWLADAERREGDLAAATRDRLAERRVYEDLLTKFPTDAEARRALIVNKVALGAILASGGHERESIAAFTAASHDADELVKAYPERTDFRARDALAWLGLSRALLKTRHSAMAAAAADRAYELAQALAITDPTDSEWSGELLGDARIARVRVGAEDAATLLEVRAALAPMTAEAARLAILATREPSNVRLSRVAAEAALLAGDHALLSQRPGEARVRWSEAVAFIRTNGGEGVQLATDRDNMVLVASRQRLALYSGSGVLQQQRLDNLRKQGILHSYAW